jgi:hypothetical protein
MDCSSPASSTVAQGVLRAATAALDATPRSRCRAAPPRAPQAILHPDAHEEGGLACNDKQLLLEMRE